jgi:hypothetical protein
VRAVTLAVHPDCQNFGPDRERRLGGATRAEVEADGTQPDGTLVAGDVSPQEDEVGSDQR